MLLSRVADALYWMAAISSAPSTRRALIDVRLDLGLDRRPDSDGWDFDAPVRRAAALDAGRRRRRARPTWSTRSSSTWPTASRSSPA